MAALYVQGPWKPGRYPVRIRRPPGIRPFKPLLREIGPVRNFDYSLDRLMKELGLEESEALSEVLEEGFSVNEKPRPEFHYGDRQHTWCDAEDDSGYVTLSPYNPGPNPELGAAINQVKTTFFEGLLTDKVDPEHMKYWFTDPVEGWNAKPRTVERVEELPGFFANSRNVESGRRKIAELKEGYKVKGRVSELWFNHGIKVDIGFEYDGLVPMNREAWAELGNYVDVGDKLEVEVVRIRNEKYYRWPVELSVMDPEIQKHKIPTEEWDPPVDMRGKSVDDIERHTNRRMPTTNYFLPDMIELDENPLHGMGNWNNRPEPLDFSGEEWEKIQQDYFDDMADLLDSLGDFRP